MARVEFDTPSAFAPNLLAENVACLLGSVRAPTLPTQVGSGSVGFCANPTEIAMTKLNTQDMRTRFIGWIGYNISHGAEKLKCHLTD
jgi:hypothetical protein